MDNPCILGPTAPSTTSRSESPESLFNILTSVHSPKLLHLSVYNVLGQVLVALSLVCADNEVEEEEEFILGLVPLSLSL